VSALTIGAPVIVGDLDMGKLKGDVRELAWAPDGKAFYLQTADGPSQTPKFRHYTISVETAAVTALDAQPDWAVQYWEYKSDRAAPGIGSLMIDVEQKIETIKAGTGPAGALDRTSSPAGGGNIMDTDNIAKGTDQYQKATVIRLKLLDETVSEFLNERPVPGMMFSWGPEKSGAIAYTDRDGRLTLFDQGKHRKHVSGAKDAVFPAWTTDGSRLAWLQKSGRKRYTLKYATVDR
jgi:hypothetical protein